MQLSVSCAERATSSQMDLWGKLDLYPSLNSTQAGAIPVDRLGVSL